jgi:hypothetical protein
MQGKIMTIFDVDNPKNDCEELEGGGGFPAVSLIT